MSNGGFPGSSVVKNKPDKQEMQFRSRVGKIPWRRKWQPTPIFLLRKSHGQRSLEGYSPWSHKELDTTEPWRRAWQPTPVFLPGESPWAEETAGSMGLQRVGHAWAAKHTAYLSDQTRCLMSIWINKSRVEVRVKAILWELSEYKSC